MTQRYGPAWRLAYNNRRAEILAAGTQSNGPVLGMKDSPHVPDSQPSNLNVLQFRPRSET